MKNLRKVVIKFAIFNFCKNLLNFDILNQKFSFFLKKFHANFLNFFDINFQVNFCEILLNFLHFNPNFSLNLQILSPFRQIFIQKFTLTQIFKRIKPCE